MKDLHSTMYLLKRNSGLFTVSEKLFTFHYVSIKTLDDYYMHQEYYSFTFHYVSIKTVMLTVF